MRKIEKKKFLAQVKGGETQSIRKRINSNMFYEKVSGGGKPCYGIIAVIQDSNNRELIMLKVLSLYCIETNTTQEAYFLLLLFFSKISLQHLLQ